jgi:hypothetical protein
LAQIVSLSLPPQALGNLHFHSISALRGQLMAINAATAIATQVFNRRAEFDSDVLALRAIRDVFAGLEYRLDELAASD